jgi:SAM-dependent methyltransferase
VTFAIAGSAYDNFMGRYSVQLAPKFADFCGISGGERVLDVGCGPGALTSVLVERTGAARVCGIEPSAPFFEACRARLPEVDLRHGGAELLPWQDAEFDAALAQLVLSFVTDAAQVAREMRRVVRPGGCVAACMWLEGKGLQISDLFWEAVGQLDPALRHAEQKMTFRRPGDIARLWSDAGLMAIEETTLEVRARYRDFDELWGSIERGAGPLGGYMAQADADRRQAIRRQYFALLAEPQGAIELGGRASAARARV